MTITVNNAQLTSENLHINGGSDKFLYPSRESSSVHLTVSLQHSVVLQPYYKEFAWKPDLDLLILFVYK